MTAARPAAILRHLESDAATDAELLARFLRRDEAAFAGLVRRHGPMILAVCRRITRHTQDAEDAFQAVFLILAKKAAAVREPRLLGNWLYGVAVRVAQKARRGAVRRRAWEVQTVNAPEPLAPPAETNAERDAVLHDELATLPAKFREPIVLCDLRGITRTEAAEVLGIPVGTLSSRLSAGREKLAERLHRRGIALAAAAIPGALAENAAASLLPDSLVVKTCGLVAGWQAGAAIPTAVHQLMQGGLSMRATVLMGILGTAFAATGLVLATRPEEPTTPGAPPKPQATAKSVPAIAAPESKEERFTTKPQLNRTFDLPITDVERIVWDPTGSVLAILAYETKQMAIGKPERIVFMHTVSDKAGLFAPFSLSTPSEFLEFSLDGSAVITALREYGLVSGRHQLDYWRSKEPVETSTGKRFPLYKFRSVDLGAEPTYEYAFAADGKTYRTLVFEGSPPRISGPIEVREISTETGKTLRTPLKVEGKYAHYLLSPNGQRLALQDELLGITVWNVDKAKKESTPREPIKIPPEPEKGVPPLNLADYFWMRGGDASMFFSPNSRYLLIVDSLGAAIFDNETGKFLPKLEGKTRLKPFATSFSAKNELVVMSGIEAAQAIDPRRSPVPDQNFLKIWEVKTGKLLKQWPSSPLAAWSPVAPVLAVIERNGDGTRLGLWDFSAEADGKSPPR